MSGSWVLDSEALSQVVRDDRTMAVRLAVARKRDVRVALCAATIIEADHDGVHPARPDWVLWQFTVLPVDKAGARTASGPLKAAALHGQAPQRAGRFQGARHRSLTRPTAASTTWVAPAPP